MNSLISSELLKLRTTRAPYVALVVVLVWAVAGPVLVALNPAGATVPNLEPASLAELMRGPARLAGGAMLLIGLLASAGEFRHGTVLTTRLAEPRSTRVLLAKAAALTGVGLAAGVLLDIVTGGAGAILLATHDVSVQPLANGVPRVALLVPALMALHAALGVAIGSLLRNTAAAVGVTLMWAFVVEGILPLVIQQPAMGQWLPSGAVSQMLAAHTEPGQLAPAAAAALLAGYAAALFASSVALDRAREL
jgi:ABC-2 type transport system permease protein